MRDQCEQMKARGVSACFLVLSPTSTLLGSLDTVSQCFTDDDVCLSVCLCLSVRGNELDTGLRAEGCRSGEPGDERAVFTHLRVPRKVCLDVHVCLKSARVLAECTCLLSAGIYTNESPVCMRRF
jgi:hypothetical protein